MLILISTNIVATVLDLMRAEVFSLSDGSGFTKNVIIFGADMNSSVHVDNKKKYFDSWQWSNIRIRQYQLDCRERIFDQFYKAT